MLQSLDRLRRLIVTGLSFSAFGVGGLILGVIVFPLVHLASSDRGTAERRCQYLVHRTFRFFIWMLNALGVLSYEVVGAARLRDASARVVIANHPSLIDVVFIVAMIPQALCVVKRAAWSNPFMAGIMSATGYIPNDDPFQMIDDCVLALDRGQCIVIFPEGTRTVPGRPMKFKRGAASVIVKSRSNVIPIIIQCEPTTLTKGNKWYNIPHRKPHFQVMVGDQFDPSPVVDPVEPLTLASRRMNIHLVGILSSND
ncbi:MAG: lysophospholipid acyltransferase family protein [Thalassobaculaceae bacterium]|nr:lysophospholipid acyltransferase family protein [Thalassobaculaceae bacterium]